MPASVWNECWFWSILGPSLIEAPFLVVVIPRLIQDARFPQKEPEIGPRELVEPPLTEAERRYRLAFGVYHWPVIAIGCLWVVVSYYWLTNLGSKGWHRWLWVLLYLASMVGVAVLYGGALVIVLCE
jgi:hypothetical protein